MTQSVSIAPMAFFQELIKSGFFDHLIASLKFLLFESTRHRSQFPTTHFPLSQHPSSQVPIPFEDVSDMIDRSWTRRLAQIASRVLLVLAARFHLPPSTLLPIAELLGGSVFDETAIRRVVSDLSHGRPNDPTQLNQQLNHADDPLSDHNVLGGLVTAKDFDVSTEEDLARALHEGTKTTSDVQLLQELKPSKHVLDMVTVLTLLLINLLDPTLVKWAVDVKEEEGDVPTLSTIEFPTARLSDWLNSRPHRDSTAVADSESSWLAQRSFNHDLETFWEEGSASGRLVSFAVSVAFSRPSDLRRLQLALSSTWNLFSMIKSDYLDRLGGGTALSKVASHTLASLLEQSFLPINSQWSQIIRTDKLSRQARRKMNPNNESLSVSRFNLTSIIVMGQLI